MAGCSDDSSSSKYYIPAKSSLSKPIGTDPLKTGVYKVSMEGSETPFYYSVDTENLTITKFYSVDKIGINDEVSKYTYNGDTNKLTMATYMLPFPKDTDAYLESFIDDSGMFLWYEGECEFYGKTEYIAVKKNFLSESLKPHWEETIFSKIMQMKWGEFYDEEIDEAKEKFTSSEVYSYSVEDEDTVTLTTKMKMMGVEMDIKYTLTPYTE